MSGSGPKAEVAAFPEHAGCSPTTDIRRGGLHVRLVPILLQKYFWGGKRKFLETLMRFTRGDVRDHIVSSKIDHGAS